MKKLLFPLLKILGWYKRLTLRFKLKHLSKSEYRVVSGQAWDEFCDNLKSAGAALIYGDAPLDPFNQAEGYRYLARLTRTGLNAFVENTNPAFIKLERMIHETAKIGADNPDNHYINARISPIYEYKIKGKRNNISFLSFHIFNGEYGQKGGIEICSEIASSELKLQSNGEFEINISQAPKENNWLKIDSDSTLLIVRQTFLDRATEIPAELELSCLNGPKNPAPLTCTEIDEALRTTNLLVGGSAIKFSHWAHTFMKHKNTLPLMDEKLHKGAGGDENLRYHHSYYEIEDDECLVINTEIPKCDYWNFQVNNHWMESLDYRYERIHINKQTAAYNMDGSITVVVAKKPIIHKNYLSTTHHNQGTMLWRWLLPDRDIIPNCQVMKIDEFEKSIQQSSHQVF